MAQVADTNAAANVVAEDATVGTAVGITALATDADVGATGVAALKTSIIADGSFRAGEKTTFLNVGINHNF